jgi:hypothetical protein
LASRRQTRPELLEVSGQGTQLLIIGHFLKTDHAVVTSNDADRDLNRDRARQSQLFIVGRRPDARGRGAQEVFIGTYPSTSGYQSVRGSADFKKGTSRPFEVRQRGDALKESSV